MSKLKNYSIIFTGTCPECGQYVSGSGAFIARLDCPNVVIDCPGIITMRKKLIPDQLEPEE